MERFKLVYDGEYNLCIRCVGFLMRITKKQVEFFPFQSSREMVPRISINDWQRSIHCVDLKGNIFQGSEAIFRTLACVRMGKWLLWMYKNAPGFTLVAGYVYKIVSKNRKHIGSIC